MADRNTDKEKRSGEEPVYREFREHTAEERGEAGPGPNEGPVARKRWTQPIAWIVTLIIIALFILAYIALF